MRRNSKVIMKDSKTAEKKIAVKTTCRVFP